MPMEEAHRRCGSLVSAWLMTQKTTSPARRYLTPSFLVMILQPGGKMLLTRTMLKCAIPASRSAISNEFSFSRCRPTPLVRNIFFDTNIATLAQTIGWSSSGTRRFIAQSVGGRPGSFPEDPQDGASQGVVGDRLRARHRGAAVRVGGPDGPACHQEDPASPPGGGGQADPAHGPQEHHVLDPRGEHRETGDPPQVADPPLRRPGLAEGEGPGTVPLEVLADFE